MVAADQMLLSQWIAKRDAQAFKTLTKRYCAMVYGTSVRILRCAADAEDVTQECFAALASAPSGPQGSMGAWLHRVATHKALNHRRSDLRRREREEQFARARATMTEAQWDDISQFIDQSIEALPDKIRMAVVAHFIEDESVTAIAARESVTHSAISQRIQKGVELIRERMRRNGIPIGVAAIAAMLSQQASAWPSVPAGLSARLGKLALTGGATGRAAATAWLGTKSIAGIAAALIVAGTVALYATFAPTEPLVSAQQKTEDAPAVLASLVEPAPVEPASASAPAETVTAAVAKAVPATLTTWQEVVAAYTVHQERIRRIRFDYTNTTTGTYFYQSFSAEPGNHDFSERGSLITDGIRCAMKQYLWGRHFGDNFPANKASFSDCAYNGDVYAQYDGGGGNFAGVPGSLQIHPDAINSAIQRSAFNNGRVYLFYSRYPSGDMLGFPLVAGLRMEEFLFGANQIALRPGKESIGGMQCYVVDADTAYGDFTVWFNPERDYNVAKSIIVMGPGDIFETNPLPSTTSAYYEYLVEQFTKESDCWVPKESTSRRIAHLLNDNGHDSTLHHKRSNIKLLALGEDKDAYVIYGDDIPNGAHLMGKIGEFRPAGAPEWRWQDGEFVLVADTPGATPVDRSDGASGIGAGIIAASTVE